ncbi:hypothetical protein D3C71_1724300 [compost metagenome]
MNRANTGVPPAAVNAAGVIDIVPIAEFVLNERIMARAELAGNAQGMHPRIIRFPPIGRIQRITGSGHLQHADGITRTYIRSGKDHIEPVAVLQHMRTFGDA